MKGNVLILAGGGPAPGINTVISSVAKVFLRDGYKVIGLHDGYKNLFTENPATIDIDFEMADLFFSMGGSAIRMSRYKPADLEFKPDFFIKNNVKLLVTIGGDDTASTANRISKFLVERKIPIQNIHVPKTIDNDLPLPEGQPTFGYQSAKQEGVRIGRTIYEDARTSANWFVVSAMGREAGHLAFGIGAACHYPMIIIPEMFNKTKVSLDKITKLIISSIIKRRVLGIPYGCAIVSEGVFHFMSDEDIESSGIQFTYDEHGHPELGTVSKAHIYNMLLQIKLKQLGINIKSRPVEMGYELRCIAPTAYDLMYCSFLGIGVKKLFDQGLSGCVVTSDPSGDIYPLFLKDVEDANGKVKTRMVSMNSQKAKMVFEDSLQYLCPEDMDEARKFLRDPEEYQFKKILNWD
ncbi:MAG TPA: 6-phosphofructokinase [Chitinophagaceae bacterium]|jgi:6-phosphofructokinase 1|nr:6-phosphofructokinase [Chitinophagaceae bacterium]HMU58307.1 6-phosphofructokinase [Chitinophagaceae bacterium]